MVQQESPKPEWNVPLKFGKTMISPNFAHSFKKNVVDFSLAFKFNCPFWVYIMKTRGLG